MSQSTGGYVAPATSAAPAKKAAVKLVPSSVTILAAGLLNGAATRVSVQAIGTNTLEAIAEKAIQLDAILNQKVNN